MQDSRAPIARPAATARPGERKLPKIAAIRPFNPMVRPESHDASVSGEHQHGHPLRIDAHEARRPAVERARSDGAADLGEGENDEHQKQ
jgi:hypothetical protein